MIASISKFILLLSVSVLMTTSGCIKESGIDPNQSDTTGNDTTTVVLTPLINVDSIIIRQNISGTWENRSVLIHSHSGMHPDSVYPVVFAFHGPNQNNASWEMKLGPLVDSHNFIGIYPQGYNNIWNLGTEPSTADDTAFIRMIIDTLRYYKGDDTIRKYAIGMDNGGGLLQRFARQPNSFRTFAVLGFQLTTDDLPLALSPSHSVLQINGSADPKIPYAGGAAVGKTFLHAKTGAETWATAYSCNSTPTTTMVGPDSVFTYGGCNMGNEIKFKKVEGANHSLNAPGNPMFYPEVWNFLKQH